MEDVQDSHFLGIFYYAEDDKVVAYRVSAVSYTPQDRIAAEFMRGGKLFTPSQISS